MTIKLLNVDWQMFSFHVSVKARAYNCQIRPAVLDTSSRVKWTNTSHQPPFLVGEEVRGHWI